ncbi:phenylcoumaran benzylic ether reductase Betv6-like [Cornus florida]|uniref:phenylcoumaran benzylic ether reductase Betv6-like n=1 Tax=Cornus florida TaxID=4283 RepID=UPI0028A29274|nr:phenylcoumaran benzylic ether reductase Betv6-like [Cornus florida]
MAEQRPVLRFRLPRPAAPTPPPPRPTTETPAPTLPTSTAAATQPRPAGLAPVQSPPQYRAQPSTRTESQPPSLARVGAQSRVTSPSPATLQPRPASQPSSSQPQPTSQLAPQPRSPSGLEEPKQRATTITSSSNAAAAKQQPSIAFQAQQKQPEKEEILDDVKQEIKNVISNLKDKITVSETRQKPSTTNGEQAPLHKEIKDDISKFVHKMATGQTKHPVNDKAASVIILCGENSGASMQRGRSNNPRTTKDEARKSCVNSNTQCINNSIVFTSSVTEQNAGVQLFLSHNPRKFRSSSLKISVAEKSKILIIGGTGYIGKFIVEASVKAGHPTFALVRESTVSDPVKGKLMDSFKNAGVTLLYGDLYDHESLVKAIKQVDVVISTVGHSQLVDQVKIIAAVKEAGNVKRFFPSEFGNDVDRVHPVEPAKTAFSVKAQIRRAIEAEGIPHTYVASNCFAGYFLPTLVQPGATAPPRERVIILGDGNPKAIFNEEHDISTYTIKAVDDPRTLNKILYLRPSKNIYSFNELVSLWEKKIGKTLERIYVPEEKLLKDIQEATSPINVFLAIHHSVFVKGDHTNFEIEPSFGVEASELYPDVKYTTVEEYLDQFV